MTCRMVPNTAFAEQSQLFSPAQKPIFATLRNRDDNLSLNQSLFALFEILV